MRTLKDEINQTEIRHYFNKKTKQKVIYLHYNNTKRNNNK